MSRDAQAILEAFDHLPRAEREQVAQAVLRRVALTDHESPTDDELVAAADAVFSIYDEEESKL